MNSFCNNCGWLLVEGAKFCPNCGWRVIEHRLQAFPSQQAGTSLQQSSVVRSMPMPQHPRLIDLTTKQGIQVGAKALSAAGAVALAGALLNFPLAIAQLAGYAFYKGVRHVLGSLEVPTDQQVNAVKEIIRAGKHEDVSKLRIKLSREVGLMLGSQVDGVPVRIVVGTSGEILLEVYYK